MSSFVRTTAERARNGAYELEVLKKKPGGRPLLTYIAYKCFHTAPRAGRARNSNNAVEVP